MLKKNNLIYIIPFVLLFTFFSRYTILSIFHLEKVVEEKPIINNIKENKDKTSKKEIDNRLVSDEFYEYKIIGGKYLYKYVTSVDSDKFRIIDDRLAVDDFWTYWNGSQINITPNKMVVIKNENTILALKDEYRVFIAPDGDTVQVNDADPASFDFNNGYQYPTDKNHVYYVKYDYENSNISVLPDADPKSFKVLGKCQMIEKYGTLQAKDSKHVYVENKIIPDADAETYNFITTFSLDIDIPSMFSYSKDKNNIFYNCGNILKDADYKTFEYIGNGIAQDKNYKYNLGEFNSFRVKR